MNERSLVSAETKGIVTLVEGKGMVPQDLAGLWRLACIMAKSGMMPKGLETPESVAVATQMGLEVGLSPMAAVQNIAVINGRPSIWGDSALALVRASGKLKSFNERFEGKPYESDFQAVCKATRTNGEETERSFSVQDAKEAGLWGKAGPWTQYKKRMLQMRARSWTLRDGFGDVLKGLRVAEEVIDIGPQPDGHYGVDPSPEPAVMLDDNTLIENFYNDVREAGFTHEEVDGYLDVVSKFNDKTSVEVILEVMRGKDLETFLNRMTDYEVDNGQSKQAADEAPIWDPRTEPILSRYSVEKKEALLSVAKELKLPESGKKPSELHEAILTLQKQKSPPESSESSPEAPIEDDMVDDIVLQAKKTRARNHARWDAIAKLMRQNGEVDSKDFTAWPEDAIKNAIRQFNAVDMEQSKF